MAKGIAFDGAAFARVVRRYQGAQEHVRLVQTGLVSWALTEATKEARRQLVAMVYSQPARQGNVYRGGRFLGTHASVRTGATMRAITRRGGVSWSPGAGAAGEIHVDPSIANRAGFFYPIVLERGRRWTRYYPRPF